MSEKDHCKVSNCCVMLYGHSTYGAVKSYQEFYNQIVPASVVGNLQGDGREGWTRETLVLQGDTRVRLRRGERRWKMCFSSKLARVDDEGLEVPRAIQDLGDPTQVKVPVEHLRALSDLGVPKLVQGPRGMPSATLGPDRLSTRPSPLRWARSL
jgi:hypothetical protein